MILGVNSSCSGSHLPSQYGLNLSGGTQTMLILLRPLKKFHMLVFQIYSTAKNFRRLERSTPDTAPYIQWGWISLQELRPPFALTSLNSLALPHDRFSIARAFLHSTRMREMCGASLFTYTEIYLYRSLLRTPFSLPPPLPVECPSLLKFYTYILVCSNTSAVIGEIFD